MTATAYQDKWLSYPQGRLAASQARFGVASTLHALKEHLQFGVAAATAQARITSQGRHMDNLLAGVRAAGLDNTVLTDFQSVDSL